MFGSKDAVGSTGLLTPGDGATGGTGTGEPTTLPETSAVASTTTSTLTTPPPQTQRPGAEATAAADQIVKGWANLFYKRTPATETYAQLVETCETVRRLRNWRIASRLRAIPPTTVSAQAEGRLRSCRLQSRQPEARYRSGRHTNQNYATGQCQCCGDWQERREICRATARDCGAGRRSMADQFGRWRDGPVSSLRRGGG